MRMVLSCVSHQHSHLKQEWGKAKEDPSRPPNVLGRSVKPPEEKEGSICIIDEEGSIHSSISMLMPMGILVSQASILVTSPWGIHRVSRDLTVVEKDAFSLPLFNSLHTITRTQSGFLVTCTGLDLLLEFDQTGKILWRWWALDHGLCTTPLGRQRYIKRSADHRGTFYSTVKHTTHINSATELPNGDILASLFHQGMVIYIQRSSGKWKPILENLDHPHFVRLLDADTFTVADTGHGRAILARMSSNQEACIKKEVKIDTPWLQDYSYDRERGIWLSVDAHSSRVVMFNEKSSKYSYLGFDPEWRLFSIEQMPQ